MVTHSGVRLHPLDPKPGEIRISDVAHGLSNVCRFGGQCRTLYTVAEHSVRVAHWLMRRHGSRELAAWGLVHDAAEAYLGDVIRPLKGFFPAYRVVEEKMLRAITGKLKLPWPEPPEVVVADGVVLACEARDLMPPACLDLIAAKPDPAVWRIEPAAPRGAKFMWEREFLRLFGRTVEEADRG